MTPGRLLGRVWAVRSPVSGWFYTRRLRHGWADVAWALIFRTRPNAKRCAKGLAADVVPIDLYTPTPATKTRKGAR